MLRAICTTCCFGSWHALSSDNRRPRSCVDWGEQFCLQPCSVLGQLLEIRVFVILMGRQECEHCSDPLVSGEHSASVRSQSNDLIDLSLTEGSAINDHSSHCRSQRCVVDGCIAVYKILQAYFRKMRTR